ncbi:hypothetical protein ACHAXN_004769 [Cyclotella atomus]
MRQLEWGQCPLPSLIPSYFDILVRMLYNTSDWNLMSIEARLLDDTKSSIRPRVDPDLANSETGVRLNWNSLKEMDRNRKRRHDT